MKKFFYFLIAASAMFAACESANKGITENVTLTITSGESIEATHEGGQFEITYTLEGAKEGAVPTVTCKADWITDITIEESIKIFILANDGNESRFAPILINYGKVEKQIMVKQLSPNEAALKASYFGGEYYGSVYSPGMGNYYLFLSDNGFNDKGMDKPNSKYYCMDLYGPLYEGPDGGEITLPVGTYTLNTDDEPKMWTMGWKYSHYRETDSTGMSPEEVILDHATLVVTEDGATLECSTAGVKHRVVFSGQATIIDARY
jgi:hypothetical protein